MGSPAARLGDMGTGHGCFPPRQNIQASSDTIIEGLGAHRVGDLWEVHCCDDKCHMGSLASGSSTVFVNGRQLGRIGDQVDCGSTVATGAATVIVGG